MFCTECGRKLEESEKFCTNCGNSQNSKNANNPRTNSAIETNASVSTTKSKIQTSEERWWHRLARVIYYGMYINLLWMVPLAWTENDGYCTGYGLSRSCEDSYDEAFWAVLLTVVISIAIWRGIKLVFLYIVKGQTVNWKKEFKSFF